MSMVEQFFSVKYAGRGDLFEGLSIWQEEKYQRLQGTYPVISLSFAAVKEMTYTSARKRICGLLADLYADHRFLLETGLLAEEDQKYFRRVGMDMDDADAAVAVHKLSKYLYQYYGKTVIILLDEYDTPMQEAYVSGFWDELVQFTRTLFNAIFKTNPYLARALMTGITRVSRESMFSDLNHLKVVTTTSNDYATAFGFTEEEVFAALEEFGLEHEKEKVKHYEPYRNVGEWDVIPPQYELVLTNREVVLMFRSMILAWFQESGRNYNDFVKAMLLGDKKAMNFYMNRVALQTFSYFDTGKSPWKEPERFYHGFAFEGKQVLIG